MYAVALASTRPCTRVLMPVDVVIKVGSDERARGTWPAASNFRPFMTRWDRPLRRAAPRRAALAQAGKLHDHRAAAPITTEPRRTAMPYVNIKVTDEGVTPAQKAELIAGVTTLLQRVLGKNPATTVVVIDEVHTDNWGIGGEPVTGLRQK